MLTGQSTVEEVTGVHLNTRFCGIYIQHDTSLRRLQCCADLVDVPLSIQHPVVVISITILQLLIVEVVNACSHGCRSAEVHRRTLHRQDLSCSHVGAVHRSE